MEYNLYVLEIRKEIVHELSNAFLFMECLDEIYASFLDITGIRLVIVTISCALEITVKDIMRMT